MLLVVIGTRPEIIKTAPVIKQLKSSKIPFILVWSGQHYDYEMSKVFFEELNLPEPDVYLENVKDSPDILSKLNQMITELKGIARKEKPIAMYGLGDTTTTLATAITAAHERIPFIHDEAGMRSFDFTMLEEVNRVIADRIASLHLAPTKLALLNLLTEGIQSSSIKLVGSTLVDVLKEVMEGGLIKIGEDKLKTIVNFEENEYVITLTLHRRENLVCKKIEILSKVIGNVSTLRDLNIKIVFPVHPHTRKMLEECGIYNKLCKIRDIFLTRPLGYLEFIALLKKSKIIITDSGGVQEEAFILGKHTITLRNSTEWPETIMLGYNTLINLEEGVENKIPELIIKKLNQDMPSPKLDNSPIGDGKAATRIVKVLKKFFEETGTKAHSSNINKAVYYIPSIFTIDRITDNNKINLGTNDLLTLVNQDKVDICIKRVPSNIDDLMKSLKIKIEIDWNSVDNLL